MFDWGNDLAKGQSEPSDSRGLAKNPWHSEPSQNDTNPNRLGDGRHRRFANRRAHRRLLHGSRVDEGGKGIPAQHCREGANGRHQPSQGTSPRNAFRLQYPSNWRIDVDDEDYDPDTLFSIESPGSTFVLFEIGKVGIEPEHYVQDLIRSYRKRMSKPVVSRFERYGRFTGKGQCSKGGSWGSK